MSKGYCEKSELTAIAEAIRGKTGKTDTMALSEMPSEITNIQTSLPTQEKSVSITANGSREVTADDGYALSKVDISVAVPQDNDNNAKFDWSLCADNHSVKPFYKIITSVNFSNIDSSIISKDMSSLFSYFEAIKTLDLSNVNCKVTKKINNMFSYCYALTDIVLPADFGKQADDFSSVFYFCKSLTNLNCRNINTANATTFQDMFGYCNSLSSLDLSNFNTTNVTNISGMFRDCENLKSLDLSSFDTQNLAIANWETFCGCKNLNTLTLSADWGINTAFTNFNLEYVNLSHDSCLDVFNKLADKTQTETTSATLSLSSATKALMSEDEIKIATDKGWTIS